MVNTETDKLLSGLSAVVIPVSPTLTSYTAENVPGEGLTFGKLVFEFSDFDLDGDGNAEGCTGCTCPVGCAPVLSACPTEADIADLKPVCFRIWISGIMFPDMAPGETTTITMAAAGKFDKFLPTPDNPDTPAYDANPGAGELRFKLHDESPAENWARSSLTTVTFSFKDPLHPSDQWSDLKVLETVTGAVASGSAVHAYAEIIEETEPAGDTYHRTLMQLDGIDSSYDKPLDIMGQYRADQDFWSVRVSAPAEAGVDVPLPELGDTCVRFSTGSAVADDVCIDLGIFTDQLDFLLAPVESDVTFPVDYPAEPPI